MFSYLAHPRPVLRLEETGRNIESDVRVITHPKMFMIGELFCLIKKFWLMALVIHSQKANL